VPALIAERKEASEIITALRKKQGEIRDAFNARWQEFKKQERAWRVWAAHERVSRQEERKKEFEERQAARKQADKASRPSKWETSVYECEQAIAYLRSLVSGGPSAAAAPAKAAEEAPAPGMKLLKKKDEDLGGLFAGTGGKKGKGAKREAAKAVAAAAVDKAKVRGEGGGGALGKVWASRWGCQGCLTVLGPQLGTLLSCGSQTCHALTLPLPRPPTSPVVQHAQKLVLRMDDLKMFLKLGVKAPTTTAEVPTALEVLEAKKKEFEEKRDKVGCFGSVGWGLGWTADRLEFGASLSAWQQPLKIHDAHNSLRTP